MEIMITHDHLDARGMRIVNQRADLRFIIEQFDIDNINQSTACGLAVERKIGFVAELGFATFFLTAEGKQQRKRFQRATDFRQRGHHWAISLTWAKWSTRHSIISAPASTKAVGVTQYLIQVLPISGTQMRVSLPER